MNVIRDVLVTIGPLQKSKGNKSGTVLEYNFDLTLNETKTTIINEMFFQKKSNNGHFLFLFFPGIHINGNRK